MSLPDLLAAMRREAEEESARIQAAGRLEAERILKEAAQQARRLEHELAHADDASQRADASARVASARLAASRRHREALEACWTETLAALHERLSSLRREAAYPSLLEALLREALDALPAARLLRVDPADLPVATQLATRVAPHLRVVGELSCWGGVELEAPGGRRLRNTLQERLSNAEPALRALLARRLAAPPDAPPAPAPADAAAAMAV